MKLGESQRVNVHTLTLAAHLILPTPYFYSVHGMAIVHTSPPYFDFHMLWISQPRRRS